MREHMGCSNGADRGRRSRMELFEMRYSQGHETWGFEHWSVAWRLIKRVRNATSVSARKATSGPSVSARKSVRRPTSGARRHGSSAIEIGAMVSFGSAIPHLRESSICTAAPNGRTPDETQSEHRWWKTEVRGLWSPPQRTHQQAQMHSADVRVPRISTAKRELNSGLAR